MKPPDKTFAVFISSTTRGMKLLRAAAQTAILDVGCVPIAMEYFHGRGPPDGVINKYLSKCDAVFLIADARYGSKSGSGRSFVEEEYETARKLEKPIYLFVRDERQRKRKQQTASEADDHAAQESFIRRIGADFTKTYRNVAELTRFVTMAATALREELPHLAGYVRWTAAVDAEAERRRVERERDGVEARRLFEADCRRAFDEFDEAFSPLMRCVFRWCADAHLKDPAMPQTATLIEQVLAMLNGGAPTRPVMAGIGAKLLGKFLERLRGLSRPEGFVPESPEELEVMLDELFGPNLRVLKATSIYSNLEGLAGFKRYWEGPELSTVFMAKNSAYIGDGRGETQRVFLCDSIADCVTEPWFRDTVLSHVKGKAKVKVMQLNPKEAKTYEDFGIYEHAPRAASAAPDNDGRYLLLAPPMDPEPGCSFRPSVTADDAKTADYAAKFETYWSWAPRELAIAETPELDEAAAQREELHGSGRLVDLFKNCVVLRNMKRLDTEDELLPKNAGFVRKYQWKYADAVAKHIRQRFPDTTQVFYVGDTYKNDGAAIRNLQRLFDKPDDVPVHGFICEPKLKIRRLWFNRMMYTDQWTDLVEFAAHIRKKVGPQSLGIFDIDQTLWAPKGVLDAPLDGTRTRAILDLVNEYVEDGSSEVAKRARERIQRLYKELGEVKYHRSLTLDNEDYKAAICVFCAFDALVDRGAASMSEAFERAGRRSLDEFMDFMRNVYLKHYLDQYEEDARQHPEAGVGDQTVFSFFSDALAAVRLHQYETYGTTHGINVDKVRSAVLDVFQRTGGSDRIKYPAFRNRELLHCLVAAKADGPHEDKIVLNKPAWDFAQWLKGRGVELLGLSDRPDESTYDPSGNLLEAEMYLYGKPIAAFLPRD